MQDRGLFHLVEFSYPDELRKEGYTCIENIIGFEAKYLFDENPISEYAALTTSGIFPTIGIDFKNNPKILTRFRLQSGMGTLLASGTSFSWSTHYPRIMMLSASNLTTPDLNRMSDWTPIMSYVHPALTIEGQWGEWLTTSGTEPYRHYTLTFLDNQGGPAVVTDTYFVNATDIFPKKLLTMPVGHSIVEIEVAHSTFQPFACSNASVPAHNISTSSG